MSEIRKWYAGKNILMTGSTGFVGKVLLEKLVRECHDINRIYLIVRGRDNFTERCKTFLNHIVFARIQNETPELIKKIKFFNGDLRADRLGLNTAELQELYDNVNVVIHNGASVRFNMSIREAVNVNVMGAYRILELAKNITHLDIFLFVSTAYSQSHAKVTEEKHYDTIIDPFVVFKVLKQFDDNVLNPLQEKILENFPTTYSWSKHLAEDLVHRYHQYFPICVVRPVVITCALRDPLENYVEGLNGYFGVSVAILRGVFRVVCASKETKQSIVPVDVVVNTIIAASWLHGSKRIKDAKFYNTTIPLNQIKYYGEALAQYSNCRFKYPFNFSVWVPRIILTECVYHYYFNLVMFQLIPSAFLDCLIVLFRQRPIMMKIQKKIFYNLHLVSKYMQTFYFVTDNFEGVKKLLNDVDNEVFSTNYDKALDFRFVFSNIKGIKKYILHEKDEDLPRARIICKALFVVDIIVQTIFYYFIAKYIWNWFSPS